MKLFSVSSKISPVLRLARVPLICYSQYRVFNNFALIYYTNEIINNIIINYISVVKKKVQIYLYYL